MEASYLYRIGAADPRCRVRGAEEVSPSWRRLFVASLLWLVAAIAAVPAAAQQEDGELGRMLFLSSYHPSFPTFFQQIDGLKAGLAEAGLDPKKVALDVEFMDSKRFPMPWPVETLRRTLRFKLGALPRYDVLVVGDDAALTFALEERDGMFAGLPIVFLGVNDAELALRQNADPRVTGVVEGVSMADTLRLIDRLAPAAGRLFAIVDGTSTAQVNLRSFEAASGVLERMTAGVLSLETLTYDEMRAALQGLGPDDALLFLSAYRDRAGTAMAFSEAIEFVRRAAEQPIYSLWTHHLGHGVVGGRMVSHTQQGTEAGRLAGAILNGADPAGFAVSPESPNRYIFDHAELQRHGIPESELPADSILLNRPTPVWEQYPVEITAIGVVSLLMAGLVVVLSYAVRLLRRSNRRIDAAQHDLRESNESLAAILDTAPDAVVIVDAGLAVIRFNRAAEEMFGWREEEILGRQLHVLIPEEQRAAHDRLARRFLDDPAARKQVMGNWQKARGCRKDGDSFPINVMLSKIDSDDGPIATSIIRDMSDVMRTTRELARLSERLERQLEVAEEANLAKSRFLANMSHELRTPLNAIIGFSEVIERETLGPLGTPKYKEYVSDVITSGLHLKSLVDDLLDFARIDEGRVQLNLEPASPRVVVAEALKAVRTLAWKRGLRLRGTAPRDLPEAAVDRRAVHQCLLNLLSNAIKFSSASGAVVLRAERSAGGVAFSVQDEGPGIDAETLPKLGQPFEQAGDLYHTSNQGAGLGLAITKSLTGLMGGEMTIESELGRGTRITLTLPGRVTKRMTA